MKAQSMLAFVFAFLAVLSCSAQQPLLEVQLGNNARLMMLTKEESAEVINIDETDGFFEKVTASELSIQMKKPLAQGETAADMMPAYHDFLRNDVADFTYNESKFLADIFEEIYKTCNEVSKDIFPSELKLIKTTAKHYGNSVFYTRENCIIIPQNELDARDRAGFTSTMYHELFHVYSRLTPEKSRVLYSLIGFEPLGFGNLSVPKGLADRVLFNPDGVDFAQKITLQSADNKTINAIPIIYSNNLGYTPSKPEFFSYLEFNLFEVVLEGNTWKVITKEDGISSTLDLKKLPDFFKQIKDNTHYIIHPDEVLADNFSFVMLNKKDPNVTARFSKEGKQLVADIETILKGGSVTIGRDGNVKGSNR